MHILTELADITGAVERMFSRITEHLPIALAGTIIRREETIILIPDKRDIPARIVLTTHIDHTADGSSIHTFHLKESENKRKGINKNSNHITGRNVLVDPRTT
ncbi:MAG: hypothetical protein A2374_04950 [Candidatus Moranbacteria bacterium RIFOXYB1_FULL_44_23]|nr:MAG: hypothetical protein A2194_01515 [Candidatus Moranbacteria bacterium RIFOXYA1_FULL_44_8]OGI39102.1 MAG: hypothetical protein A2374_04950 [Candidatus Moranbacteria bacterium RIFOXYB1_FULL_44_23]